LIGATTGEVTGAATGAITGGGTGEGTGATTGNVTGTPSVHTQLRELLSEHEDDPNKEEREEDTPVPEVPPQVGSLRVLDGSAGPS